MPIEFRCPNCNQLLRTPDESAGKQARCPQCSQVTPVPTASQGATEDFSAPPSKDLHGPPPHNPFGDAAAAAPKKPESAAFNPYASPTAYQSYADVTRAGELQHRIIDMGDVLNTTWRLFTEEFGKCVLIGLVYFAIWIGLIVMGGIFGAIQEAAGPSVSVTIGVQAVHYGINLLLQTWIGLGLAAWAVQMARNRRGEVEAFFNVGRFYLRGLAATFVLYAAFLGGLGVFVALPIAIAYWAQLPTAGMVVTGIVGGLIVVVIALVVFYTVMLYYFFIVDRDAGVLESFQLSAQYMRGNRLTAFALMLVVGIPGAIFTVCTCYLGLILYMPFLMLMWAMIYLMATGQPHAGLQQPIGQQPFKQA
ncbi:MAG: hypothetical protein KY475_18905 [Planctomycetes bacterium]|nr:hypothetical protein [Planctomycetota bacterium]